VRDYYAAIHPHSRSDGGYVNFMSNDDDHRAAENCGANYERLSAGACPGVARARRGKAGQRFPRQPEHHFGDRDVRAVTVISANGASEMHCQPNTSLIDAAREIAPILREHSNKAEREGRLSHQCWMRYAKRVCCE